MDESNEPTNWRKPLKPIEERRTYSVRVLLSRDERVRLQQRAKAASVSLSEYLRNAGLKE